MGRSSSLATVDQPGGGHDAFGTSDQGDDWISAGATALIAGPASAIPAGNESRSGVPDVAPLSATDGVSEADGRPHDPCDAERSDSGVRDSSLRVERQLRTHRRCHPRCLAGRSGAEISGETSAWVAFRAAAPQGVSEELGRAEGDSTHVQVVLREGLGLSEIELLRVIEDVHGLALNAGGVESATTTFDYATRTITTRVLGEKAAPEELSAGILERGRSREPSSRARRGADGVCARRREFELSLRWRGVERSLHDRFVLLDRECGAFPRPDTAGTLSLMTVRP